MPDLDTEQRRGLAQYLESLRRAGVTTLPRSAAENRRPAAPAVAAANLPADDAAAASEPLANAAEPLTELDSPPRSRPLFAEMEPDTLPKKPAALSPTSAPVERSTLPLEERRRRLAELAQCVAGCVRCQQLAETRTQTVFGVGNPQAKLLFIGEAPGADEDRQGEPFVGRAGQQLNDIITKGCRLQREDVYICNILKCRPPGNRTPAPEEARNCREYLDGQIAIVAPDYIVCWGAVAAQNLLDTTAPIGRLRGRFFTHGRAKVLCTYHPSYLLRNPAAKKDVWEDMKFLFRDMGVELDGR